MQRYHTSSFSSAVNNGAISGIQARDTSRAELPAALPNLTVNSRRSVQLTPYNLRCDKEQLNSRLGPPDFHPQTTSCPEETLTREYVQSGYRDTVEGLEEAREILLSHVESFPKPTIIKCKEAIRKYHRAINESRAQKRKAGQVYGVPLSGTLLSKSGVYPELRSCGEDFRKKWIEGLSQNHKRLRSLSDHVPHGYRRKSLFEVLIRNNVPLLRATWFIKVIYLNQVRPTSSNSSGSHEKAHFSRSEQWTKDVIEYLQYLLDEFMSRNIAHSTLHMRDRLSQIGNPSSVQQKAGSLSTAMDGDEPSLYTKWWYLVRIIHWHHTEGLLVPSLIIDWVLHQLQEEEFVDVVQLLLPIIYGVVETVVLSQTYVHTLLGIAIRLIQEPSPGGADLVDNSRHAYVTSAVVEMLRYLILAVPDTFVAVDCFPLPKSVVSHVVYDGRFLFKMVEDGRKLKDVHINSTGDKNYGVQAESLSFISVVSSIQRRAETLSRAARPNHPGHDVAKALQVLDQAVKNGDIEVAYRLLFENIWNGACAERWIAEVNPALQMSLKHISSVSASLICSIFFLCEWATSEYRDFRTRPTHGLKFTGRRDPSQIFIALRLLKLKMSNLSNIYTSKRKGRGISDISESPGPLHDIIVCWIDQHEVHNGEGFNRVQFLVRQLIQSGVFNPLAYVRQLIISGNMDGNGPMFGPQRHKKHQKLLKELPASYIRDALEEAQTVTSPAVVKAMTVYCNERRLVLNGLLEDIISNPSVNGSAKKTKHRNCFGSGSGSPSSVEQWHFPATCSLSVTKNETDTKLEELKVSISVLLQLPISPPLDVRTDESQMNNINSDGANGIDISEELYGCEECRMVKKRKLSEERGQFLHSDSVDDAEPWWVRKGLKDMESFRAEPPLKPLKQVSRGRQKSVRKTQSLAQLSDARIEGSQGASASHVCESKIGCPHHCTGFDEVSSYTDGTGKPPSLDILSIGKLLKKMQFFKKRTVALWLMSVVKRLIDEAEKITTKVGQYSRPLPPLDDRSSVRWRLGVDELSAILYIMDVCNEFVSAIRFLLWLFPKLKKNPGSTINGRNALMLSRTGEKHPCEVTEGFLLSCIGRYENIIVSSDLIIETLVATMRHTAAVLSSNGRISGSPALAYSGLLLRKYGNIASVVEWEKNFNSTCDKRLSSELHVARSLEGGFTLGVPHGIEDPDDYLRQKVTGVRVSRIGANMKQIVQRHVDEVFQCFQGKDRKLFGAGINKTPNMEKWDDGCHVAQKVVMGLMDCMRQTGGAAQEGDPILMSSAIAAIVNSIGPVIARIPALAASSNHANTHPPAGSLQFTRYILHIHITCLCILKEALGERHSRVFEVALATEASSALFSPGKPPRSQFQMSPESHDFSSNSFNEASNCSSKTGFGTVARHSAAVSALVVGAILHGVASLERMVTLFRLKEGLDLIQFVRSLKSNANGNARSMGVLKVDNSIEVSVNWFRVLVGNCRTVSDGFVVELLGEPSILALSRMQWMLSLNLVFPPAYSIFAFLVWRPILDVNFGVREDFHQLYQLLAVAMDDAIKHLPFREICLRDTCGLYDLITTDSLDCDFVSVLESNGADTNLKAAAVVPLRSRLFLDALIDCKMPQSMVKLDDKNWASSRSELKKQFGENMKKVMGKVVHILDTLQPARFHWQWVELRLLLNEQAVYEKIDNDVSVVEAIRSLLPTAEKSTAASETESNFVQLILTRLLVRPDAAPLFSEVVHLLGKSVEDSMLSQAKWLLRGTEVLYGKKSVRQKIVHIATELREPCLKPQYSKPWGWCHSNVNRATNKGDKGKSEGSALEEGEVDEAADFNQSGKGSSFLDVEGFIVSQQHVTERALINLILPCVDRGSDDSRYNFANEMFKQISNIEQQINVVTRGVCKQVATPGPIGSPTSKSGSRKGGKNNSSGISRQSTGAADTVPPPPAALRASLTLRLQFLIRLLPVICADREPSNRKLRCALASVILRLLGSRVVYEDAGHFVNPSFLFSKRDAESLLTTAAAAAELYGENIFDYLLLVFHVLLSRNLASWLKPKPESKAAESSKGHTTFDHEVAENLQNELDRMELPESIRWRIQTAMPALFPSFRYSISITCHPPSVSSAALACLQPSNSANTSNSNSSTPSQRNQSLSGRVKTKPHPDIDADINQWSLLEDGTGSIPPSANSAGTSDQHSNLKASSWLKGAVRVRRTELTYIGAVDEDS